MKWGIQIISTENWRSLDSAALNELIFNTTPILCRTVKDCFSLIGTKLPRVGHGYCGTVGKNTYIVTKYAF